MGKKGALVTGLVFPAILAIGLLATHVLPWIVGKEPDEWPQEEFDRTAWFRSAEPDRYVYVKDLVESRILIGMSSEAALQTLGSPSSESFDRKRYFYAVKMGGSGFDQVFMLDIAFDPATGAVKEASIRGD